MLHAMAAFAGMQCANDPQSLQTDQPEQQEPHMSPHQQGDRHTHEDQLVHRRRLMMQEEVMLAGNTLGLVQDALANVQECAQQHAVEMERRMEAFMRTTSGTLADSEAKLHERLHLALSTTHSDLLSTASATTHELCDRIASSDERMEQFRLQFETALRSYEMQARAGQLASGAEHLRACQAQLDEALESDRVYLKEEIMSQAEAKIFEVQLQLQNEISATRDSAFDRVSQLEARMQFKLDEAISKCSSDEVAALIDESTQKVVKMVEEKMHTDDSNFQVVVDQEIVKLENKMQLALQATLTDAECQISRRLENVDKRIGEEVRAIDIRVRGDVRTKIDSRLSDIELRLTNLLNASSARLTSDTRNHIAAEVSKLEARIIQSQQDLLHRIKRDHTDALTEAEARMIHTLNTSRAEDAEKMKIGLATVDKQLERRVSAAVTQALLPERQNITKALDTHRRLVEENIRRMESLTTSRHGDEETITTAMKTMEKKIESRVSEFESNAISSEQLNITKELEANKQYVQEKFRIIQELHAQNSDSGNLQSALKSIEAGLESRVTTAVSRVLLSNANQRGEDTNLASGVDRAVQTTDQESSLACTINIRDNNPILPTEDRYGVSDVPVCTVPRQPRARSHGKVQFSPINHVVKEQARQQALKRAQTRKSVGVATTKHKVVKQRSELQTPRKSLLEIARADAIRAQATRVEKRINACRKMK